MIWKLKIGNVDPLRTSNRVLFKLNCDRKFDKRKYGHTVIQ